MQRQARLSLATALILGSGSALAQNGDLAGVTMRVLDDIGDVAAVVLELDTNRGEGEESAAGDHGAARDAAADDEDQPRDADRRDDAVAAGEERGAERRERDELHDADADERGEGRLEDRDVELRVAPPATVP